ncbi:MAG: NUDIX domain-containing protein, partial [Bacteroidota bacterium]
MNDRAVTITQATDLTESDKHEMTLNFSDKSALRKAYKRFEEQVDCVILIIKTSENFVEACAAFNSMFTRIEAAGGIVRNQKEEYLFIKRLGIWDLPKGKLNKNEKPVEGALREVSEETGLTVMEVSKQLPSTYHIYTDRHGTEI